MSSLISELQKQNYETALNDIHDTFSEEIICYKDSEKVVITKDASFNPLYDIDREATSIVNTVVSGTYRARIQAMDDFGKKYFSIANDRSNNTQFKVVEPAGTLRMKIDIDAYNFIKDCKRFDVEGRRYELVSLFKPHGLFNTVYYTIYLKPVN
jgi:hypothetical protein